MDTNSINENGVNNPTTSVVNVPLKSVNKNYPPLIIAIITVVLLLIIVVVLLAISGNKADRDKTDVNVNITEEVTPSVTIATTSNKIFQSDLFSYEFDYPQDWNLVESQGFPVGMGPYTREDVYFDSSDNKIRFELVINPEGWDGADEYDNIEINGKSVPFAVILDEGFSTYYYNGAPDVLGLEIDDCDGIEISYKFDNSLDVDESKDILVNVVSSIRSR